MPIALPIPLLSLASGAAAQWMSRALRPPTIRQLGLAGVLIACGCTGSKDEASPPLTQEEPGFYQELSWSPNATSLLVSVLSLSEVDPGYMYRIWRVDPAGGEASPLTDGPRDYWTSWSPDGSRIAFAASVEGRSLDVFTMRADGSDWQRLTFHDADDTQPSWSPDGRRIAFISNREEGGQLWLMNADGSEPAPLVRSEAEVQNPVWSPDGTRIAFYETDGQGSDYVVLIEADGSDPRRLGKGLWPSWTPDGESLLYSGDGGLYRLALSGGQPELIIGGDVVAGELSPDGVRLAYILQDSSAVSVVVSDADGGRPRRLMTRPAPDW